LQAGSKRGSAPAFAVGRLPELPRADNIAVIAAAGRVVSVVPPVLTTDPSAIFAFRGDTEIDQKPGQLAPNPCPPPVGVTGSPMGHRKSRVEHASTRVPSKHADCDVTVM
jgi:hypothetical protein